MGIMQLLMSAVASGEKKYVEEVFSPDLYPGNSSTRTITNSIDLDGEGGMVWFRPRDYNAGLSPIHDSVRGWANRLSTSSQDDQFDWNPFTSINDNGFTIGNVGTGYNDSSYKYVAWTFRKCPGFFDVIEYTGNGAVQAINHNLECKPGCIIVKNMEENSTDWTVWHKNLDTNDTTVTECLKLNSTAGQDGGDWWGGTLPTSTQFSVGHPTAPKDDTNKNGIKYIAYLFADGDESDAQIFGDGGDESIVKCGAITIPGTGLFDVNLGWEPQYVMIKRKSSATGGTDNWQIHDNMREFNKTGICWLEANTTDAEDAFTISDASYWGDTFVPYARGFKSEQSAFTSGDYIYIAIRRGPMKQPTAGTDVFAMNTYGETAPSPPMYTSGFPPDMEISFNTSSSASPENRYHSSRLLGRVIMYPNANNAEVTESNRMWDYEDGMGSGTGTLTNYQSCLFRRAPGFFDVVAYNGDASNNAKTVYHNLGVKPELIFTKCLSNARNWIVTCPAMGGTISGGSNDGEDYDYITGFLDLNNYFNWRTYSVENNMTQDVTTTTITYAGNASGGNADLNYAGYDYVAYLFASKSKVSAIGQYTGTGSAVNVDCGFVAPARFVLIKRIGLEPVEATGDWYLYDSKRGISSGSGNDPYILLNTTAASTITTDYIDQYASGFTVTSSAPAALNGTGTYLYLAIA